jgi:hypothetical protein
MIHQHTQFPLECPHLITTNCTVTSPCYINAHCSPFMAVTAFRYIHKHCSRSISRYNSTLHPLDRQVKSTDTVLIDFPITSIHTDPLKSVFHIKEHRFPLNHSLHQHTVPVRSPRQIYTRCFWCATQLHRYTHTHFWLHRYICTFLQLPLHQYTLPMFLEHTLHPLRSLCYINAHCELDSSVKPVYTTQLVTWTLSYATFCSILRHVYMTQLIAWTLLHATNYYRVNRVVCDFL